MERRDCCIVTLFRPALGALADSLVVCGAWMHLRGKVFFVCVCSHACARSLSVLHTCTHTKMPKHTHTQTHSHAYTHNTHTHTHSRTHAHTHTHTLTLSRCTHTRTHTLTHTKHTHTHTHTQHKHIHTHTHTHTHTHAHTHTVIHVILCIFATPCVCIYRCIRDMRMHLSRGREISLLIDACWDIPLPVTHALYRGREGYPYMHVSRGREISHCVCIYQEGEGGLGRPSGER